MILLGATPAPVTPTLRIVRVVTEDEMGRRRYWTLERLRRWHPELFAS